TSMTSGPTPHVLILAAGAASRFGSPKQLARLQGQTLLQRAVALGTGIAGQAVTVVLGAHAAAIAASLRGQAAGVVINRRWEEGLASSLRAGVAQLPGSAEGVLVMLADQVGVSAFDLQRLVSVWRQQPDHIAAARYGSQAGVPAIFPPHCSPAILELRGDAGARMLLNRMADRVVRVPMPGAAIDVDTPDDLQRLQQAAS